MPETTDTPGGKKILRELARDLWPDVPVHSDETHALGLRDFTDEDLQMHVERTLTCTNPQHLTESQA